MSAGGNAQEAGDVGQIIFASQPKQREFWLGGRVLTVEQLKAEYGGCKPRLHGSDAHDHGAVGKPSLDRFSWIKGDLRFEALRQSLHRAGGTCYPPVSGVVNSQRSLAG